MKLLEKEDVDVCTFQHEQQTWSPSKFHKDPMVNAVLNVAAQLSVLASATNGLLYGLKYGKKEGLSVAEALEAASKNVAHGLESVAESLANREV
jgi:microcystin degradation protein MlrC